MKTQQIHAIRKCRLRAQPKTKLKCSTAIITDTS